MGQLQRNANQSFPLRHAFKAIWTGLIGSALDVASTLGLLPGGLSQADVQTVVLAITGIGGVVFRKTAKARIG